MLVASSAIPARSSAILLADHIALRTELSITPKDLQVRVLQKGPAWTKPQHLTSEEWTQLLAQIWDNNELAAPVDAALADPSVSINTAWELFNKQVNRLMKLAFQQVLVDPPWCGAQFCQSLCLYQPSQRYHAQIAESDCPAS